MSSAKIIGIHGGKEQIEQAKSAPLPRSLVKLRDAMKQKSTTLLRRLFESADDMLFAMADKAGSAGDQASYFDAMRELRLKKKMIALEVIRGVIQSFNEIGHYRCSTTFGSKEAKNFDELGLVETDELELNVAVEAMISRVRNRNVSTLEELRQRIESLVAPVCITPDQMPMSPEILCSSFLEGCADLELDIRAKLVLLKLFEKSFLEDVCRVYAEANALLLQMGVLPNLKRSQSQTLAARKAQHQHGIAEALKGASANTGNAATYSKSQVDGLFQDLRTLLRNSGFYADAANGGPESALVPQSADVSLPIALPVYSPQQLVSTLTSLQGTLSDRALTNANDGAIVDFKALLEPVLSKNSEARKTYSEMDLDTINLVSMLFEFILEDRQLQPAMKALIARLQIPVLKVALLDRSFFNKGGHPARKLVNEMASAALGWTEGAPDKPDRLKQKIEEVVYKVLDHFDNNVELFAELLNDFQSFMESELRRGRIIEQRIRDAEEGKAINEQARLYVQELINQAIRHKSVCKSVIELLRDGWSAVMVLHYLKHGEHSEQLQSDTSLVNDLIWTVCPDQAQDSREKMLAMIPGVIKRLRAGFSDIGFDELKMSELLANLEQAHVDALQNLQEQLTQRQQAEEEAKISELARETAELEQEFNAMLSHQQSVAGGVVVDTSALSHAVERIDARNQTSTEEIILVQRTAETGASSAAECLDEDDPFVRQVDNLTVGCWFEFYTNGQAERCKLAALIRSVGKYIFVNRSGIKVAEKTRLGLAAEMRSGQVQVLNDGLLFDRALESIITNLRNKAPQQPGA